MELVKGIPITQFCDENQLTPRQRLELFLPVCQAIQHAHQKGIIHRDIKPSNILVAEYDHQPVPKVIDFGVAKATGQELTEKTMFTALGQIVGTLEYMSPEQAKMNQLDIDTRSDIYSLGVLLYELLTGTTPFDKQRLRSAAFDEILRIIREEEPPKPSTRLSQVRTARSRAPSPASRPPNIHHSAFSIHNFHELDWIVMKALEKDRNRRYETVSSLGLDIQRYLHDEPVTACPPSLSYRLSKFTRRYKAPLAVAASFLALLLVGIAVSSWQAIRATSAESVALAAADAARQAKEAEASERARAEANAKAARENEQLAAQQRDAADREKNNTLAAQEVLRETLYAAEMNLVAAAWDSRRYSRVSQLLAQQRPAAGKRDLRGFEWHYWQRQLNRGRLRSVQAPALASSFTGSLAMRIFTRDAGRVVAIAESPAADGTPRGSGWLTVVDAVTGRGLVPPFDPFPDKPAFDPRYGLRFIMLSMSDDGKTLAAAPRRSYRNAPEATPISIRDGGTGKELRRIECPGVATALALTADGSRLAAQYVEQTQADARTAAVKIFDTSTGDVIQSLPMLPWMSSYGQEMLWSPDGTRLLRHLISSDSKDNKTTYQDVFQVIQIATGQTVWQRGEFAPRTHPLQVREWSPDGKLIVFFEIAEVGLAEKHHVQLWDSENGATLAILDRQSITTKNESNITFTGDSQKLAAVVGENEIYVWQLPKFTAPAGSAPVHVAAPDATLRAGTTGIQALAFSASGHELHCVSGTAIITLDATAREDLALGPDSIDDYWASSVSDDATKAALFTRGANPHCVVWDLTKDRELFRVEMTPRSSSRPRFSPDGRRLALVRSPVAADEKAQLLILDSQTGNVLKTIPFDMPSSPDSSNIVSLAFRPDGRQIAGVIDWTRLVTWDLAIGEQVFSITVPRSGAATCYSPDGASVIVTSLERGPREVIFFSATTGERQGAYPLPNSPNAVFIDPRHQIVACSQDADCVFLDLATGQERLRLPGLSGMRRFAISPDGSRIALGSQAFSTLGSATELTIVNLKSGRPLLTVTHLGHMEALTFSPDGNRLVASFWKLDPGPMKPFQIWDATPLPEESPK